MYFILNISFILSFTFRITENNEQKELRIHDGVWMYVARFSYRSVCNWIIDKFTINKTSYPTCCIAIQKYLAFF